jgi:hypothetical protein
VQAKNKFIAFVDILGFSDLVKAEEQGGRDLSRPLELVKLLGSAEKKHLPSICPHSRRLAADIDFKMTQVSDCVVVSAEVSPAGVMNLAHYCFGIAIMLLNKGALCRGYITRGNIFHDDHQFIGTGYVHAVQNEKSVAFMRADAQEEGTPFIQIDETVTAYVRDESDDCVRKMFARIVRSDESYTAIYPFEAMSKIPSALITWDFNPREWKENLQKSLGYREQDLVVFEQAEYLAVDEKAKKKVRHYKRGLEEVIHRLRIREAALDKMIATGIIPYGGSW